MGRRFRFVLVVVALAPASASAASRTEGAELLGELLRPHAPDSLETGTAIASPAAAAEWTSLVIDHNGASGAAGAVSAAEGAESVAVIPTPGAMSLMALGAVCLTWRGRRASGR